MAKAINAQGNSDKHSERRCKEVLKKLKTFEGRTYTLRYIPGAGWVASVHGGKGEVLALVEADTPIEAIYAMAKVMEDDHLLAELNWFAGGDLP